MSEWIAKKGKIDDLDRSFDYKFWQSKTATERLAAAWQMVIDYHLGILGEDESKLRLQRYLVVLKQRES